MTPQALTLIPLTLAALLTGCWVLKRAFGTNRRRSGWRISRKLKLPL